MAEEEKLSAIKSGKLNFKFPSVLVNTQKV
jgi:hypothetical protein